MDVLFVNSMYFQELHMTDLGSIILQHRLDNNIDSKIINFDRLIREGEIELHSNNHEIFDTFAQYIAQFNPKIVQFYTVCLTYPFTIMVARRVKEIVRDVIIIFGGPQASAIPRYNLEKFDFIDIIGIGEGEPYFNELIKALLFHKDLSMIQSIAYRTNDSKIIATRKVSDYDFTKDYSCDYISFDYGKEYSYFLDKGTKNASTSMQIEAGRGCPYNCTFCSTSIFWNRKCKMKPISLLTDEINEFHKKYGFKLFSIDHDMFTANRKYVIQFCNRIIESNYCWKWTCSARLDSLDKELIQIMRKANCYSLYCGVETGSQSMQIALNKNLNISEILDKVRCILNEGIRLTLSFIYGFIDESESDFLDTISLIEQCFILGVNTIQLHKYFPLSNTVEGEKVKDALYLDIQKCDMSIAFNMELFSGEILELIESDSNIFSCFYDFNTLVRCKYSRIDHLITCFTGLFDQYARTIQYLIRTYGLQAIYLSCENMIRNSAKQFQFRSIKNSFFRKNEVGELHDLMRKIIEYYINKPDAKDRYLRELAKFDENIFLYLFHELNEPIVFCTECDVTNTCKNAVQTYYKIEKDDEGLSVEKLILSCN